MITIYHNLRCSKSREGLQMLELLNQRFTIVKYLNEPLSRQELTAIIKKLGIAPIDLVRQKETVWKELYKDKQLTDDETIDTMVMHPTLIERPIAVHNDKAVVARPAEKIKEIL
ncbi:arsenate reductase (glutaredoxin) [Flavobacterium sp.]|uniref:arsenate reductase (glutaredoxin) n=1 Tax=Flavobacterium sp. TaxID=239 RepID=UPI002622EE68|nr:arsenate reductase (glutaredoxin) [Flavobacterium sp.]